MLCREYKFIWAGGKGVLKRRINGKKTAFQEWHGGNPKICEGTRGQAHRILLRWRGCISRGGSRSLTGGGKVNVLIDDGSGSYMGEPVEAHLCASGEGHQTRCESEAGGSRILKIRQYRREVRRGAIQSTTNCTTGQTYDEATAP